MVTIRKKHEISKQQDSASSSAQNPKEIMKKTNKTYLVGGFNPFEKY